MTRVLVVRPTLLDIALTSTHVRLKVTIFLAFLEA